MDFEQVVRNNVAGLHRREAGASGDVHPWARFRPRPGLTIEADWVIGTEESLGFGLQCMPTDMATTLPQINAFMQQAYDEIFLHNHDYFELAYLYQGEVIHHLEDEHEVLHTGDLVFLSPHVLHEMQVSPGSILMNVVIRPNLVSRSVWAALADARVISDYLNGSQHVSGRSRRRLSFRAAEQSDPQRVRTLLEEFGVEATEKKRGWGLVCESLLTAVFTVLSRQPTPDRDDVTSEERLVQDVLVWVRENSARATLQAVADRVNYSPSYVSRLVSRHTHRTLATIVRDAKLDRAIDLLEHSTLPVASIAREVGFSSASHLHAIFRERYAVSPGEWRQRQRAGPSGASERVLEGDPGEHGALDPRDVTRNA